MRETKRPCMAANQSNGRAMMRAGLRRRRGAQRIDGRL